MTRRTVRKIRILTIALIFSFLFAENLRWYGDYERAREQAVFTGKFLLVYLVAPDRPLQMPLIRELAEDRVLSEQVGRLFIPVLILARSRSDYPIELYYTTWFPPLFFMDPVHETPLHPPRHGVRLSRELREILLRLTRLKDSPSIP